LLLASLAHLDGGLGGLGVFDQLDDAGEHGFAAGRGDLYGKDAGLIDRSAENCVS